MTLTPTAAFLAGALLTLLLPVLLLIALAAWYWVFSARVPETDGGSVTGTAPAAAPPAQTAPPEAAPPAHEV